MSQEALVLQVKAGFGKGVEPVIDRDNVIVEVSPGRVLEFARFAKEQLGFDYLTSITAIDNVGTFELQYHFVSIQPAGNESIDPAYPGYLQAKVTVPKDLGADQPDPGADFLPVVPSITQVFPGANQQEREVFDLMGIRFKGHPRMERILLWEGFPGHPLRKDWHPVNAEIPWHLAGMRGYGGGTMDEVLPSAQIAVDGSGMGQPVALGTTIEAPRYPVSRPPKPSEVMRLKLGQNGLVEGEGPEGPTEQPGIGEPDTTPRIEGSENL